MDWNELREPVHWAIKQNHHSDVQNESSRNTQKKICRQQKKMNREPKRSSIVF